jgi:hypothetical protein
MKAARCSVLAAALMLAGGCPESAVPQDAGVDGPDRGLTLLDQAPGEPWPDLGPDLAPDGPAPDLMQLDWGEVSDAALSKATVLYTVTANTGSFGLRTVSTDGTGSAALVPDWTGYVDLDPLKLAGAPPEPDVVGDAPHVTANHHQDFQGVRLPGGLGTLYYFHQKLLGTSGLLLVQPDGGLKVLLEVTGVYVDTLASPIGLSPDGKVGAVVVGKSQVLLFRTDGTTFSNGQSWADVTGSGGQLQLKPHSLTLAQGWLYCVGATAGGEDQLVRAPLDGSTTLTQVTLPASDGSTPVSVGDRLTASPDRSFVLVAAGASSTARDLYKVASQSGAATNITGAVAHLEPRADCFGPAGCGLLAIAPAGNLVAYIANVQGNAEVFLTKTDGSKTTVQVTSDTRFQPQVNVFSNLYFADDDNLLFMAGVSLYDLDLYHWDNKTAKAANLTGSTATPFNGLGSFYTKGAWISPNGNWLYWIEYRYHAGGFTDLRGVDLTARTVVQITQNAAVVATSDGMAACHKDGKLYFSAEASPGQHNREVWVFDQNQGTPATKLTTMSVPLAQWYVYNLRVTSDCTKVAWTGGGNYILQHLWIMNAGGSAKAITKVPLYYDRAVAFTPDTQTLVFGSGGSEGSATLKAVPAVPNASPTTLDTTAGYVHIFAVY